MDARNILIRPVISEKSYALIAEGKYTFRVDDRAHKTQIAQAVHEVFGVNVAQVRTSKVRPKPKRRGLSQGRTRSWKKAIVQLAPGERIELFKARRPRRKPPRCRTAKPNRPAPGAASRPIRCASS
jgi:Ribosomal protein L23